MQTGVAYSFALGAQATAGEGMRWPPTPLKLQRRACSARGCGGSRKARARQASLYRWRGCDGRRRDRNLMRWAPTMPCPVAPSLLGAGMRRFTQGPSDACIALRATGMRWAPTRPEPDAMGPDHAMPCSAELARRGHATVHARPERGKPRSTGGGGATAHAKPERRKPRSTGGGDATVHARPERGKPR
jgi:hypothetical protein